MLNLLRRKLAESESQVLHTRFPVLAFPDSQICTEKVAEAPLLPTELAAQPSKNPKHEMQDFLDDLLS